MTRDNPLHVGVLDSVVDATYPIWYEGLERDAYSKFYSAQMKTAWGRLHQSRFSLMDVGDLPAIAAMGRGRADRFRFPLDRDVDLVQYAITRKRLLAGLGPAGVRELHFFIAEEGTTAAAYVVISVVGKIWTLEECGDRDSS